MHKTQKNEETMKSVAVTNRDRNLDKFLSPSTFLRLLNKDLKSTLIALPTESTEKLNKLNELLENL